MRVERERIFHLLAHSPNTHISQPALGQIEARTLELHLGVQHVLQGSQHLSHR